MEQLHGPLVIDFLHGTVGLVVLDQVIVPLDAHHRAGAVVEQVVRHPVPHALELDGRGVGAVYPAEVVDGAVLHEVVARGEGLPVSADCLRSATADDTDVAAEDAAVLLSLDGDPVPGELLDRASRNEAVLVGYDGHAVVAPQENSTDGRAGAVSSAVSVWYSFVAEAMCPSTRQLWAMRRRV